MHHFVPSAFPSPNFAHPGPALHHPRTCITPYEDLHVHIRGPASHHPWTCITPSKDLYHIIRGPASDHPRTCITPSKDLQQIIQMDLHVTQAGSCECPDGV